MLDGYSTDNRDDFPTMTVQVEVWEKMLKESRVIFILNNGDEPLTGTIRRNVWTSDGSMSNEDLRDDHVRITLTSGMDKFVPFASLVQARMEHKLGWDF